MSYYLICAYINTGIRKRERTHTKQYNFYWKLWQSKGGVTHKRIDEPLIVESRNGETKLIVGHGILTVFPFFQDEEGGWYSIYPPEFDGEVCEMWFDRANGTIYTVAVEGVVEVLAANITFTQLFEGAPKRK